jgi:dihydrofolate reductase
MHKSDRPDIVIVVARADNGVIGRAGGLPWHLPADLKHFKRLTVGRPVIMGRKTYESIGRPLPGRHNIVVTRNPDWQAEGVSVAPTLLDAVAAAGLTVGARPEQIMIIGGADIYAQALLFADRVELTEVHQEAEGDTAMPVLDPATWQEIARTAHPAEDGRPAYSFVTLVRRPA